MEIKQINSYFLVTIIVCIVTLASSSKLPQLTSEKWHQPGIKIADENQALDSHKMESDLCPATATIAPCVCTYNESTGVYITLMDCTNVTTEAQLQSIFEKEFPTDFISHFKMSTNENSEIAHLSSGVFGSKKINLAMFHHVDFTVSPDCFDNMTNDLMRLEFWGNPMINFTKDFSSFTKMTSISIQGAPLKDFNVTSPTMYRISITDTHLTEENDGRPCNLGRMENLQQLFFQINRVNIAPDTSGYPTLKKLLLSMNNISSLAKTHWMTRSKLDEFRAYHNQIEDIHIGVVRVNPGALLDFQKNNLTKILFRKWYNLFMTASYINLAKNPIVCDCRSAWLFIGHDREGTSFLSKLNGAETCSDGTKFTDLNAKHFHGLCKFCRED